MLASTPTSTRPAAPDAIGISADGSADFRSQMWTLSHLAVAESAADPAEFHTEVLLPPDVDLAFAV